MARFGLSECTVEVGRISEQLGTVSSALVASFGSSECSVEVGRMSKQLGAVSRASRMGELAWLFVTLLIVFC